MRGCLIYVTVILTVKRTLWGDFMVMGKNNKKLNEDSSEEQVFGNERYGIPSDCTKKQKMSGFKLTCYIVIVAVICTAVYSGFKTASSHFLPEMTFDKSDEPFLYVKNGSLMIKKDSVAKAISLNGTDGICEKDIFITEDDQHIFYGADRKNGAFSLYLRKLSKDGKAENETVLIDSDVTEFKAHPKGQFVVYLKGDRLYISHLYKPSVISVDVNEFYLSKNSQQIIYYKEDGKMYTCPVGDEIRPVMVDDDIEKLLSPKNEYADIYYIKNGTLYNKKNDAERVLISENVTDAILLGKFLYFTRYEAVSHKVSDYVADDLSAKDKTVYVPDRKNFIEKDDFRREVLNEEDYEEAKKSYEEKLKRDEIRDFFAKNPPTKEEFVLYTVKNDEVRKVDVGLTDGILKYYSSKDTIVYRREAKNEDKIEIDSLLGVEDAIQRVDDELNEADPPSMYVLSKDKKPYLVEKDFPDGEIEVSLDGKYIYATSGLTDKGKRTLTRYSLGARSLKNKTVLKNGVTDFEVDGADSSVAVVFDGNAIGICIGKEYTHLSDRSFNRFFYVDKTMFFYDNYDYEKKSGNLKLFREGKVKTVDVNVYDFDVRNLKTVSYIKNYNSEQGSWGMYLKNGNKRRRVDSFVSDILK